MQIEEEAWTDLDGTETTALHITKDGDYTISEFIELLEAARTRFGDSPLQIHDTHLKGVEGVSHAYLHPGCDLHEKHEEHGEVCYEEDTIHIYI